MIWQTGDKLYHLFKNSTKPYFYRKITTWLKSVSASGGKKHPYWNSIGHDMVYHNYCIQIEVSESVFCKFQQ